jgi:RNAse (barnase) inhibitor barstar
VQSGLERKVMPAFIEPQDYQRLDFTLLQNGSVTLYFRPEYLGEDVQWLKDHGYRIDSLDCSTWDSEAMMFESIAITLDFPEFFGRNLDALNDCLSDIEIPEQSGRVLVFYRYDQFAERMPDLSWPLIDIIETNSRYYLLFGRRLMALLQSDDPKIAFEPVGACPVEWNPREFLNQNRGV